MRTRFVGLAALCFALVAPSIRADELTIGDPAPKLDVSKFVKGEEVTELEPGKTYVVEFWATWCGPCRATIPHLTELAHQYKQQGVRVIGVDAFERDTSLVEPFLKEMGDKMDYSVALDNVPEGEAPNEGAMAKTYMEAAGERGIPTAFVIHDGKIAWIGHPMRMDEPLKKIVAGDWDIQLALKERTEAKEAEAKMEAAMAKVINPYHQRDAEKTLAAIEEVTSDHPELAERFGSIKFEMLVEAGKADEALAFGEKMAGKAEDNAMALNNLAWFVVDPKHKAEPDPRLVEFALRNARRAVEQDRGQSFAYIDTLARALFLSGDLAGAVENQEKAIQLMEKELDNPDHPVAKELKQRLKEYRQAAEDQDDKA